MKQDPARFDECFAAAHTMFKKKITTFSRNSVHAIPGYDVEDLEQELFIVLARVVRDYDPDKGASLNTVAQQSFQNRIKDLIRQVNTKSRTAILVYLDGEDVQRAVERVFNTWSAEDVVMAREALAGFDPDVIRVAIELSPHERRTLAKRGVRVA